MSATVGAGAPRSGYGRGARILAVGIATTGVVTLAYFVLAAQALGGDSVEYKRIALVWSIMFTVASVIYRPIEQLLSRTIADRRARGQDSGGGHLRVALLIQAAFAATFVTLALALRGLNMARGAYLSELGNTPGHCNHWSKRSFVSLLSRHGEVVEARSPFPWTMLLVRL